jgi:uncharacterized protein YndB with AHSA1/START domain
VSDLGEGAGETLRIERTFNAPVQAVFDAWTSAEWLRRWWHAEHDWETPEAQVDARVGGAIRVVMRNPQDGTEYGGGGEYTVIDPPERLAFTWTWDGDDLSKRQLIEIEFIDHGARTRVVMTNSGLPAGRSDEYRGGWQNSFDNLEAALSS